MIIEKSSDRTKDYIIYFFSVPATTMRCCVERPYLQSVWTMSAICLDHVYNSSLQKKV